MRYRNEGAEYSLGRELPGELYSLVFIPAPLSWGEGGFLSLFSLDWKCHGVSAWWELLICKANFTVIRTWWAKDYIQMPDIPSFSHLSLSASGTLIMPKCVFSMSVQRSFFSLSAQGLPLLIRCMVFCNLAYVPLSLFIFSYLPAQKRKEVQSGVSLSPELITELSLSFMSHGSEFLTKVIVSKKKEKKQLVG